MDWLRRLAVGFLSLVLFFSLIGGAQAVSANIAFRHPDNIESWLDQSKFYDHFIDNALDQAQKSVDANSSLSISFKDAQVRDAAKKTFTPDVLKKISHQVLTANYAWLDGSVPTPTFSIDLTQQKQQFADEVGKTTQTYLAGLPVCTTAQLQQLQNELTSIDPFALPCRPPMVTPQLEASLVTQELNNSKAFLDVPVITANSSQLNPNNASVPYYQRFSKAPRLYQLETKLPWMYGVLALISLLGIIALARTRRRGARLIGFVMVVSGLFLIAIKLVADKVVNRVAEHVFNQANIGPLQESLTDFMRFVEHQIVKVDFLFGIAFLVIGVVLAAVFFKSGAGKQNTPSATSPQEPQAPEQTNQPTYQQPPKRPRLIQ